MTVLRDGRNVASLTPSETSVDDLVRLMVGRAGDDDLSRAILRHAGRGRAGRATICAPTTAFGRPRSTCAQAKSWASRPRRRRDAPSWRARFSAPTASCRAPFASTGQASRRRSGATRCAPASALVPENRKTEGLALMRSVQDNVLVAGLRTLFPAGWYRAAARRACRRRRDRASADRDAVTGPARPVSERRQPAEGRRRQVAHRRVAVVHLRRADARHRRRRQGRDLYG